MVEDIKIKEKSLWWKGKRKFIMKTSGQQKHKFVQECVRVSCVKEFILILIIFSLLKIGCNLFLPKLSRLVLFLSKKLLKHQLVFFSLKKWNLFYFQKKWRKNWAFNEFLSSSASFIHCCLIWQKIGNNLTM